MLYDTVVETKGRVDRRRRSIFSRSGEREKTFPLGSTFKRRKKGRSNEAILRVEKRDEVAASSL